MISTVRTWLRAIYRRFRRASRPGFRLSFRPQPDCQPFSRNAHLTVISANLWHDWPRYRHMTARLENFALMVEEERADLVLLQEVTRRRSFHADRWLARRLGMAHTYSRANGSERMSGFEEGSAILSRYPLNSPAFQPFSGGLGGLVRRQAVGATVNTPFGPLFAVSTHLSHGPRRNASELHQLKGWVSRQANGFPAVIGGDFNAHETSARMRTAAGWWTDTYRRLNPEADGTTFELMSPWGDPLLRRRYDYLFLDTSGPSWRVSDARHITARGLPHSDHRAVLARLEAPATDQAQQPSVQE